MNQDVWKANLLKGWIMIEKIDFYWIGIDFWKAELCWYDACWITGDCISEVYKFEFNFEWDEGNDKVYWKNS